MVEVRGTVAKGYEGVRDAFAHPEYGIAAGFTCNSMLWDNFSPDPRWNWTVPLSEIAHFGH